MKGKKAKKMIKTKCPTGMKQDTLQWEARKKIPSLTLKTEVQTKDRQSIKLQESDTGVNCGVHDAKTCRMLETWSKDKQKI